MNPFQSLRDYELLVYALPDTFASIVSSTLVVAQRRKFEAEVTGEISFRAGYRLVVYERLFLRHTPITIEDYGYELWRNADQLYWYDSQPHPNDPTLASTHPHHKHMPPDIKHHRIPAPSLSFTRPNLPFLIQEIEALL
jgi:hypothetical protein